MSDVLGSGWRFPVAVNPADSDPHAPRPRAIATAAGQERVRESIWMILATAPGERVMRPEFGCAIHDLVFATNDASTAGLAAAAVRDALLRWEPRVDVLRVEVEPAREPGLLLIEIEVRLRATDSRFSLVYPFYAE